MPARGAPTPSCKRWHRPADVVGGGADLGPAPPRLKVWGDNSAMKFFSGRRTPDLDAVMNRRLVTALLCSTLLWWVPGSPALGPVAVGAADPGIRPDPRFRLASGYQPARAITVQTKLTF